MCVWSTVSTISIHAPAKGATNFHHPTAPAHEIFQSTLPRRERRIRGYSNRYNNIRFQSTLPRRERLRHLITPPVQSYFNPRSREGSDSRSSAPQSSFYHFNPRSREGSDLLCYLVNAAALYFNPRSREGSDADQEFHIQISRYFNPRSREGSDFYWFTIIQHMNNFNPRSREGSDSIY